MHPVRWSQICCGASLLLLAGCAQPIRDPVISYLPPRISYPRQEQTAAPATQETEPAAPGPAAQPPAPGVPEKAQDKGTPEETVQAFLLATREGRMKDRIEFLAEKAGENERRMIAEAERKGVLAAAGEQAKKFWGQAPLAVSRTADMGAQGIFFEAVFTTSMGPDQFNLIVKRIEGKWRIVDLGRVPPKKTQPSPRTE